MASSTDKLTLLQREMLDAFFEREDGFFLTGGAALAGFYLEHRTTDDLDLFAVAEKAFERGVYALVDAVAALGGSAVVRQEAPGFRRYFITRGEEGLVVDLVMERVPQLFPEKRVLRGIRIDPPEEIFANKLTTLVSRAEIRDLVDVMFLERAGYSLDDAAEAALEKDAGCTPATLAWVLSQIEIGDRAHLPADVSPKDLCDYLAELIKRLRRKAAPI